MKIKVVNGRIAARGGTLRGADIEVAGHSIVGIAAAGRDTADRIIDLEGGWLLPGFVDTQVNGGGGVLFNDQVEVDAIAAIGATHARFGTTAFLPTLISDTPDQIAAALAAVDLAIAQGVPGVVGVHIEGPFINEAKRGIHEAHRIRRLDPAMLELLIAPHRGRVMLTLAPELCDLGDIRTLVEHGVIVSAGHSNASYDETRAALNSGLRGFTHLFNAMSALHHREPGMVGAAFDSDAFCGLIVDGVHVHPAAVRLAVRAVGECRIMLVTDAMPSVGTYDTMFALQGKRIAVRDGVCMFEDGTLAGAHLDMATALRNTVAATGLPVDDVAKMASATPADFLSLADRHGRIAPGMRADWVWLGDDLLPRATWIGAQRVDERGASVLSMAE